MTQVFLSEVNRYDGRVSQLEEGLPSWVLEHCKNHQEPHEYQSSLLAWNVLLLVLEKQGFDPKKLEFTITAQNKPKIKGVEFNISHSGDIVAVALSTSEVGVDIQREEEKDFDHLSVHLFGENELKQYQMSEDKKKCFYEIWTKKEAFHKHVGDGIDMSKIKRDLPYQEIFTERLQDRFGFDFTLSVDCIDNERVIVSII